MNFSAPTAIVQDALPFFGGAERVLASLLELMPQADVKALVHRPSAFKGTVLDALPVDTSFIDRLPGAKANHYRFLPLFPAAIARFNLAPYSTIVSSHYAAANGVKALPDQLHLSYTHTPMRYMWRL